MVKIPFSNAAAAVHFADGLLNDPGIRLCMQDGSGGGDGYEDARSLAITITTELANVAKPAGPVYRYVHGRYTDVIWLADHLAHETWEGPDRDRTIAKSRDLALLVLESHKRQEQGSRGRRLSITKIAKTLKIARRVFYYRWFATYSAMLKEMESLLNQSDRTLSVRFEELQIIE